MGILSDKLAVVKLPKMMLVEQNFPNEELTAEQVPGALERQLLEERFSSLVKPGMKIAITAGSRGISNYVLVLRCLVDFVRSRGAEPFIVAAMGSHGGATDDGQMEVLRGFGVTEESCGCPVISSMETVYVGDTDDGRPVYMDSHAAAADGIIVCNRVKPHTAFRGTYESGLMKMMAIGLGKQWGAEQCHSEGFRKMAENVPRFGKVILENSPVLFGVALLENAYDKTRKIVVMSREEIVTDEPALLREAFENMPRILVPSCDVLVIGEVGKNYSGAGMDPNITGRWPTPYGGGGIDAHRVAVLDVSPESHGNTHGIGLANATTKKLFDKIDYEAMYINGYTSISVLGGKIPWVLANDKEAIQMCVGTCEQGDPDNRRIVIIPNTLHLSRIYLSEAYREEIKSIPGIKVIGEPEDMEFDSDGNLIATYK